MTFVLLMLVLAGTLPGWVLRDTDRAHPLGAALGVALLAGLGCWQVIDPAYVTTGATGRGVAILLCGLVAVLGGGPVTAAVLQRVERSGGAVPAGSILRGGAWIGVMERAAIFATLALGWPEGVIAVVALKGLGRYPELRADGAAERFIIGSFASVLWAATAAGVSAMMLR